MRKAQNCRVDTDERQGTHTPMFFEISGAQVKRAAVSDEALNNVLKLLSQSVKRLDRADRVENPLNSFEQTKLCVLC